MSKIIKNPTNLINELVSSFWEDDGKMIEQVISQYISDAVIAVTAEDVAAQAIAWASSHNEFYYDVIDIDVDGDRFVSIQNTLLQILDIEAIIQLVENKWDANSSVSGECIDDALFEIYRESQLLDLVTNAAVRYELLKGEKDD